jgi:hypothetical protein
MSEEERLSWSVEVAPRLGKLINILRYPDWQVHFGIYFKIIGRESTNVKTEYAIDPEEFVLDGARQAMQLFDNLIWMADHGIIEPHSETLKSMMNRSTGLREYYKSEEYKIKSKEVIESFFRFMEKRHDDF